MTEWMIPRHLHFHRTVSLPELGCKFRVGETAEVGVAVPVSLAVACLMTGAAEAASEARYVPTVEHAGGGYYELPDGSRVKGKEAAEAALEAWIARGYKPEPEPGKDEEEAE